MPNNFIPGDKWTHSELPNLECLYGYSHKRIGYTPFVEITEVVPIGKTKRIGVKGIDDEGTKLYIQLFENQIEIIKEKGWLSKFFS